MGLLRPLKSDKIVDEGKPCATNGPHLRHDGEESYHLVVDRKDVAKYDNHTSAMLALGVAMCFQHQDAETPKTCGLVPHCVHFRVPQR